MLVSVTVDDGYKPEQAIESFLLDEDWAENVVVHIQSETPIEEDFYDNSRIEG